MVSIKDTERVFIGHSANNIFHGLHGKMFPHDGMIEVARIQAHSELVILLLDNHNSVHPDSGLEDSQILHSLKLLFKRLAKSHRNPTGRVHNRVGTGVNLNFVLDAFNLTQALKHFCILGFQVIFFKVVNSLYQAFNPRMEVDPTTTWK